MPGEIFRHHQRVIYAQCTIGNHVYHSRYLDILEAARGEFMRALGYPLLRLQAEDLIFPIIECRVKYLAPARYDDELIIEIWIKCATRLRLTVAARVVSLTGTIFIEAETDHVSTSTTEKPKRMPRELLEACNRYLIDSAQAL
jgi:acyl-CoA thioester hydrolase